MKLTSTQSSETPLVILGDGWSALGLVLMSAQAQRPIVWITNSGARMDAPLATLDTSLSTKALQAWKECAAMLNLDLGDFEFGTYLREFRNKAFRPPSWTQSPELETRVEIKDEFLWPGEKHIPALAEARFAQPLVEIETILRKRLQEWLDSPETFSENYGPTTLTATVEKISDDPVTEIKIENQKVIGLILGSGKEIATDTILFADRWSEVARIKGLPKPLPFTQKRESGGVLQATFTHDHPVAQGVEENFFIPLHRESGENQERHVWGFFSNNGKRSHWTLCLTAAECEENHEIGKRYRRLKQALNKAFVGTTWVPAALGEKAEFMSNINPQTGEIVRFEENVLFAAGDPVLESASIKGVHGIAFFTDGYGPSCAMTQVANFAGLEAPVVPVVIGDSHIEELNTNLA